MSRVNILILHQIVKQTNHIVETRQPSFFGKKKRKKEESHTTLRFQNIEAEAIETFQKIKATCSHPSWPFAFILFVKWQPFQRSPKSPSAFGNHCSLSLFQFEFQVHQ